MRIPIVALVAGLFLCAQAVADAPRAINIPAGDLVAALESLVEQADIELVYQPEQLRGIRTGGVNGTYEPMEAVARLLEGTQLTLRLDEATGVMLIARARERKVAPPPQSHKPVELDEIVVTGTHIRGADNETVPVAVLDRHYIDSTGYGTVVSLVESLPQNFALASQSGVSVPGVTDAGEQGAGLNLRGIGAGTTLTLLNGRRLPLGFGASAADISALPLSAIERVEVLTDGASALYGSDAVGGVVNFILRRDFTGAETRMRTGRADGVNEYRVSQALGQAWSTGHAMLSVERYERDLLRASERDFVPADSDIGSLYPKDENLGVLMSVGQQITDGVEAFFDGYYTDRDTYNEGGRAAFNKNAAADNPQLSAALGVDWELGGSWRLEAAGTFSRNRLQSDHDSSVSADPVNNPSPYIPGPYSYRSLFQIEGGQVKADGPLFDTAGGTVRGAVGLDWRSESFDFDNTSGAAGDFEQTVRSAFVEAYVPLVGSANARSGVRRLELSLAARLDDYSTFGSSVDPRIGFMWEPLKGLRLRGSYGTSYVAPNLADYSTAINAAAVYFDVDPLSGAPIRVMEVSGADTASLTAQSSKSWSFGVDLSPARFEPLQLGLNYYRIDYRGRVATPPFASVMLADPTVYGELIARDPTRAQVDAGVAAGLLGQGLFVLDPDFNLLPPDALDPDSIDVLVDARRRNLSGLKTSGLDVSVQYGFSGLAGQMQAALTGTYIFELSQHVTERSLPFDTVDTFYNPPDYRVRGSLSWTRQAWVANVFINHTDSYVDNRDTARSRVASYTVVDARAAYTFTQQSGLLSGVTLAASLQNALDRDPPRARVLPGNRYRDMGFDPTNASPMGRMVAVELTKAW